jgi:hypothetical protein
MYIPLLVGWTLRVTAAAALAIDAFVHADLVDMYAPYARFQSGISQADLFRIEAGVASLAAVLILLVGHRLVWAFVFVVSASALAAVMISRYYDIGAIGPIPDMYEPAWYGEKMLTAVAEAVAVGVAVIGFLAWPRLRRPSHGARQATDTPRVESPHGAR